MNGKSEITEKYLGLYMENIGKISGYSPHLILILSGSLLLRNSGNWESRLRKNEAYKYTNLNIFFDHDYKNYFMPVTSDFVKAEEFRCDVTDLDAHGIVLLNGFYPTINEKLRQLPSGVWIGSLNEAAVKIC